ncbi:tetratricopeptide repeat-containing diguanylate cyclase [Ectobacillus ponti]|uniref:Diguanylate cyclase n=1 Tax=Ectobacillus ponti TaxID=2961894 RepID=A0AA42BUE9_9BACI|nr:GGDEF domain-containing protein [Ectobacillus ponti]MCP8970468.1 diguanylate cyclase [Ectobacillus ponti]
MFTHHVFCLSCLKQMIHDNETNYNVCMHGLERFHTDTSIDLRARPLHDYTPELFTAILDMLEVLPFRHLKLAIQPAQDALEIANYLGVEELEMRARLVHADVISRKGQAAEGGRMFHEVNVWAVNGQSPYVLARSHRLLSVFFSRIGDYASAFEHAVRGLEHLSDSARSYIRADHIFALTNALDGNGAYDESAQWFQEIVRLAAETEDITLSLMALNNRAFTQCELGNREEAWELVLQMKRIIQEYRMPTNIGILDTIARTEILMERPADAASTLQPIVQAAGYVPNEFALLPECMLTYTVALRVQGIFEEAQATLNQTKELCMQYNLTPIMVNVCLEQARLFAAQGLYKEAYEAHCRFHVEEAALRRAEREGRARILHAVFDATEARKGLAHFQKLALRDPLTNLYNRRYLEAYIRTLTENTGRENELATVAVLDVDYFKRINDTCSHAVGDTVLVQLSKILMQEAAELATIARYGGEEFLLIFVGLTEDDSRRCIERLHQAIQEADWNPIVGDLPVTVSIGVSTFYLSQINCIETLLQEADTNLYTAKRSGRNRIVATSVSDHVF